MYEARYVAGENISLCSTAGYIGYGHVFPYIPQKRLCQFLLSEESQTLSSPVFSPASHIENETSN